MGAVGVTVVEEPIGRLAEHAAVSIAFVVERVLALSRPDSGLGGLVLTEAGVETPWVKDYDAEEGEGPTRWPGRFDTSNWGLLAAYDGADRVGGAVVAFRSPDVHLLDGRDDLAALWDLRVRPESRGAGVGAALFAAAEGWVRARGGAALKVETQNVNVRACRFYARMGCALVAIDERAYADHPDEARLIWLKEL
jgi:GNAT superfamily N-acetyltransferase